ncbi:MAG: hypothetical protein HPY69_18170 [Armatimonadetes bacterium]|nr:hypothetical protein [Armatimonadota bacterium]
MSRPVFVSLPLLLLLTAPAFAAHFVTFSTRSVSDGVGVYANGTLLLRTRGSVPHSFKPSDVARRLTEAALNGLKPTQVRVATANGTAKLLANGTVLLTVDKATALAARNTPGALVETWASGLRRFLRTPYVVLEPSDDLLVPVGEQRPLRYGGTATDGLGFTSLAPEIAVVCDDRAKRVAMVKALGKGTTVVSAALPGAEPLLVTVEARYRAAYITERAVAQVTAPPLPPDDLRRVLRNAALNAVQPGPEATIELGEPRPRGSAYALAVRATGPELLPASGEVIVNLEATRPPNTQTRELLISNQPERITTHGTLLREQLLGTSATRLLWHHVNSCSTALRSVVRVLNRSSEPARLHVIDAITGPASDEIFVGHTAMVRFLQLWGQGEGYYLTVPGECMLDLYDVRLAPGLITSGLMCLTPQEPRDLLLEITAENSWPLSAYFVALPPHLAVEPPLTNYRFEAEKTVSLTHEAGGPWTFYHIGKDYSENIRGQKLLGDYGVYYRLATTFRNATTGRVKCEVAVRASGGVARATFLIDGQIVETGLLQGAREQVIHTLWLDPGEQRDLPLRTIPESGSNYPVTLILRSSRQPGATVTSSDGG